jgi:hypothetical protein
MGASGLNDDDDGKKDGLKWKLGNQSACGITFLPLVRYRHFQKFWTPPPPQNSLLLFTDWKADRQCLGGRFGLRGKRDHAPHAIQYCSGDIFSEPRIFLLITIADSPLLGQSASGINFYDDSGLKAFIPSFFPPLAD